MNASVSADNSNNTIARSVSVIIAGCAATAIGYAIASSFGSPYPTPSELLNLGAAPTEEERAIAMSAKLAADQGNAMVWLGIAGAILGSIIAATISWFSHDGKSKLVLSVLAGAIFGAGAGCLSSYLSFPYHQSISTSTLIGSSGREHSTMIMHAMTWGIIGLGVGAACGLSSGNSNMLKSVFTSMLVAGVMGSLAGFVFPLVAAIAVPLADTSLPLPPEGAGRCLWLGLASVFMAGGLSRAS
ncbi:MAG: hypothetical protein WAO83_03705 [Fuerstiella sp.]|jgi:hypothetical protein